MVESLVRRYCPDDLTPDIFEREVVPALKTGAEASCTILGEPYSLTGQDLANLEAAYAGPAAHALALNEAWQMLQAVDRQGPITVERIMTPGKM